MFQKLIQGFDVFHSSVVQLSGGQGSILNTSIGLDMLNAEAHKVFSQYDNSITTGSSTSSPAHSSAALSLGRSIYPYEITPLIPQHPNSEQQLFFQQQGSQGQQSSLQQAEQQIQQQMQTPQSTSSQSNAAMSMGANNIYSLTAELLKNMLEYMQQDVIDVFKKLNI